MHAFPHLVILFLFEVVAGADNVTADWRTQGRIVALQEQHNGNKNLLSVASSKLTRQGFQCGHSDGRAVLVRLWKRCMRAIAAQLWAQAAPAVILAAPAAPPTPHAPLASLDALLAAPHDIAQPHPVRENIAIDLGVAFDEVELRQLGGGGLAGRPASRPAT